MRNAEIDPSRNLLCNFTSLINLEIEHSLSTSVQKIGNDNRKLNWTNVWSIYGWDGPPNRESSWNDPPIDCF